MRGARPLASLEEAFGVTLGSGEVVLAATSGGRDSAALASLLAGTARRCGATVVLAHVNHATRPNAWQDEAVVLALGAALGVRVTAVSLPPGANAEARLRDERYAALSTLARRNGAARIFTAHHVRDQAETVLLALLRGTGPDGLAGMPATRPLAPDVVLERPLLRIEPERLAAYAAARHLPYAIDPGNADPAYRRSALRSALADLRRTFPHLDEAVARCAAIVRDERDDAPRASIRAELRAALAASAGTRDVPFERLEAAAEAIEGERPGRHFLRRGVELIVSRGA
jgi:tRNA(Ile)-lysidine synthase